MAEGEVVIREGGVSGYPIGTRDEAKAENLDPKVTSTCSQPIEGVNLGCQWFSHKKQRCIFAATRNAEAGPENYGFFKKLPGRDGAEQGFVLPCYMFMGNEFELWQQRHLTGVQYTRFYQVGESITRKVRVPRHPKVDPECQRCRKGDCNLTDLVLQTIEIEPFPRPSTSLEGSIFPHDEELAPDSSIALERQAEKHKPGSQVEEIMAERRKSRQATERVSGTP